MSVPVKRKKKGKMMCFGWCEKKRKKKTSQTTCDGNSAKLYASIWRITESLIRFIPTILSKM